MTLISTNKLFTFIGCSLTVGEGLEFEKTDPNNYTNIVVKKYLANVLNLAKKGNSNYNIFITALNEILFNTPDKIFVQWSGLKRLWLYPGPDTELFLSHTVDEDYTYRDVLYKKKHLQKFTDDYHILAHDYNNLLTIINYSNILTELSKNKTQLIFINGLIPWTEDFSKLGTVTNYDKQLSDYTKSIIEFDTRDDADIQQFLFKLEKEFNSLDRTLWVNMFDSMRANCIDAENENFHPGPKSHALYAEMIIKYLEENNGKRI